MPTTLRDVALLAGVSIKTVSNVVNDYPHVRSTTRERVLAAISELGYRPNASARTLRSGRSGVIGLALPELSLPYFAELAADVISAAEQRGLVVLIEQTRDRQREVDVLSGARRQLIDGLLFSPLALGDEDADLVRPTTPLVLLGERIFDPALDHVTIDNVGGAAAATDLLLARGRRRIAVVGTHPGEVVGTAGLRLRGHREALAASGTVLDEALLAPTDLWHRLQGAQAVQRLLADHTDFDAVLALNDTLALGALHALQQAGVRVPDDIAVIGFDDSDEGRYSLPTLSSVDPGRRRTAELAVEALVRRIDDPDAEPTHLGVPCTVVERESTAPPRPGPGAPVVASGEPAACRP